ncbi:MAG: GAF domain-containing protein [Sandaracinaceae bacterium]
MQSDLPREIAARDALERLRASLADDPQRRADLEAVAGLVRESEELVDRLRENHRALMQLARSEAMSSGDLTDSLRAITAVASKMLGVARSSVWLYNADKTAIQCVDLYLRDSRAHESGVELFQKDFPGYFRALTEERAIDAHDAHTDPRTSEFSEVYLTPLGIQSMLDAPIRVGDRMIGVTCNEHVGAARMWTDDEVVFAGSLADLIALAIESGRRKETEAQLRAVVEALDEPD